MTKTIRSYLIPVLAVVLTVGFLWHSQRPSPPGPSSLVQVEEEAKRGHYRLINTDELWKRYQSEKEKILLVDTRQEWEYRTGHIKGAVNFSMEPTSWARWREKGPLSEFLGPDKLKTIVFY